MPFTVGSIAAKDGNSSAIGGGMLAADVAGSGVGPWFLFQGLVDGVAGSNKAQVTAGNALKVEDTSVQVDDAAFTPATSRVSMFGAEFDDTSPDSVDEGDGGAVRMSANRNLYVRIRDNAGNERGLNIDANGALAATIASGAASIAKAEDTASADADVGIGMLAVRKATPANTSGTDGDYEFLQISAGRLWTNTLIGDGTNSITLVQDVPSTNAYAVPVFIHPDSQNSNGQAAMAGSTPIAIANDQTWGVGSVGFTKVEDAASADGDKGVPAMAVRKAAPADSSGSDADWEFLQIKDGRLYVRATIEDISNGEYEDVAASQTDVVLGATGAAGDYINGILIIPETTSPGAVTLRDGSNSPDVARTIFTGGASSVSNLVPFFVPLGIKSVTGSWRLTTGANVHCIGVGNFT